MKYILHYRRLNNQEGAEFAEKTVHSKKELLAEVLEYIDQENRLHIDKDWSVLRIFNAQRKVFCVTSKRYRQDHLYPGMVGIVGEINTLFLKAIENRSMLFKNVKLANVNEYEVALERKGVN